MPSIRLNRSYGSGGESSGAVASCDLHPKLIGKWGCGDSCFFVGDGC